MEPLSVFFDGTWCGPGSLTNVYRLSRMVSGTVIYIAGLGNEDEHGFIGRMLGGAFGAGAEDDLDEAMERLQAVYKPGSPIYVFGFSRGGAIARIFCGRLHKLGIPVEFLGCWDTVGSFGIPVDLIGIPFQELNLFMDLNLTVSPNVKRGLHIIAGDEDRPPFKFTPWNHREGLRSVVYPGVHDDIGCADLTLRAVALAARDEVLTISNIPAASPIEIHRHTGSYKREPREVCVFVNDKPDYTIRPMVDQSFLDRFEVVPHV